MAARRAPFAGTAVPPQVMRFAVDTEREDWAPRICFVLDGACAESLSFAVDSPELAAFTPRVWIAGPIRATRCACVWEVWDHKGWRREGDTVTTAALTAEINPDARSDRPRLDGGGAPIHDHAGQAVLYAERQYIRGGDGAPLTVRSNPLLVNLYDFGASP